MEGQRQAVIYFHFGNEEIRIACGMRSIFWVDVGSAGHKSSHAVDECSAIFFVLMISWGENNAIHHGILLLNASDVTIKLNGENRLFRTKRLRLDWKRIGVKWLKLCAT
ncbi:hypothetical protein AVEN_160076-1 [Araneus ventricosus]|uniref:Uncharacterized protein n=1 Tax=Araneus ventricosus TaxID=182803 RepID=A0A4Y2TLY8_ARAVE|nr:hypothetical protein AVEN_160076-1 [Araneus ventricosus]